MVIRVPTSILVLSICWIKTQELFLLSQPRDFWPTKRTVWRVWVSGVAVFIVAGVVVGWLGVWSDKECGCGL